MKPKIQAPQTVRTLFSDWCTPRRGCANPEILTNDVWSWLVHTRAWPHAAHKAAGDGEKKSPGWCFSRYGQSKTRLPDGSIVYVGGEHEDYYDADFYIYNDVIVVRPDNTIEIYGYPVEVFPPTDFHTATLVDDKIYLIGALAYPKDRKTDVTPVYVLDIKQFSIQKVETSGAVPCWLFEHSAQLSDDCSAIICTEGTVRHVATGEMVENITTWRFDLASKVWAELSTKQWIRWLFVSKERGANELWEIGQVEHAQRTSRNRNLVEEYHQRFRERGHKPDLELYKLRYSPDIEHTQISNQDKEHCVHRIEVAGVVVRYVESSYEIAVTIEGQMDVDVIDCLKKYGLNTFEKIEGVPYEIIDI